MKKKEISGSGRAQDNSSQKNIFDLERFRALIKNAGGPAAVAKRAGMHIGSLNNYLAGTEMKISTAVTLADACGVTLQQFVFGEEKADKERLDLEQKFGLALERPAQFFRFCLLMESCQAYYLKLKTRPTLREALSWVSVVYCTLQDKSNSYSDSLIGASFADPEAAKRDPWDQLNKDDKKNGHL